MEDGIYYSNIIVLATSTIETIRILRTSISNKHPEGIGNSSGLLGKYLFDHISTIFSAKLPRKLCSSDTNNEFNPFKQKLIDKLTNCYVGLSNDRFSTYACQKCFVVATLKRKENIATELVAAFRILEGNSFGRHVVQSCKLQMFKTQKYRWMEEMRGSQNRKRVFESVFGKSKDGDDDDNVQDGSR